MPKNKTARRGKQKRPRKPARTARTADRHDLYQRSVQAPDVDAPFFKRFFKRYVGRPARVLREDFCGTAILCAHWVKLHKEHRAIGIDLDRPTLDWGRRHNLEGWLKNGQRERVELIHGDVMATETEPCDLIVALNFSYSFFDTRDALRAYLERCREALVDDGVLMLDAWGGSETQEELEEEREVEDFTYVWEQKDFDPISHRSECRIHFRFADGTELRNAFKYSWRQWTLPELQELMTEAGFDDVHVLWEGTDKKTGEGNGNYRRARRGDADPGWIAYVVGRKG